MFSFEVTKQLGQARSSEFTTPHGVIHGPFFQFVATQAAIRGMVFSEDLEKMGVQIVLANTYHLHLRPGEDIVSEAGGLHGFMKWDGPVTTDSGGYQVFSLSEHLKLDADGVTFRSLLDGSEHRLTPETAIQIQNKLGADIIMPLDVCTPFKADRTEVERAVAQTTQWAKRCQAEFVKNKPARSSILAASGEVLPSGTGAGLLREEAASAASSNMPSIPPRHRRGGIAASNNSPQALYGIVQGGVYPDLRERAAKEIQDIGFFGYSIGGELREGKEKQLADVIRVTTQFLPEDSPRYLMGYGLPEDIVEAVRAGVDQFDCVLPVRNARHGHLFYGLNIEELKKCLEDPARPLERAQLYSVVDITKSAYARDFSEFSTGHPVIEKPYTKAYVHHLMRAEAPSGFRLAVLHNIYFYVQLMRTIREIIAA